MECVLRFRRPGTVALLLALCAAAFLLMPETGSGGVMFLIGPQRVLLTSAATSLTSAVMGGLVFSLMGFYLISNSVARDLLSGAGGLIASTPVTSARYLAGKLAGNILYLTAIALAFMIACMGMHLLRGERPLEPWLFLQTFGIMFAPLAFAVAGIALLFECTPILSGRGGDLLYFLFWGLALGLPVAIVSASREHTWILAADFTGLGFFVKEIIQVTGSHNFSIGYAPYDPTLAPVEFPGLQLHPEIVLPRIASALIVIPLFGLAWLAFRRFDPATAKAGKVSGSVQRQMRSGFTTHWRRLMNPRAGWITGSSSLLRAALLDARLTIALAPSVSLLAAGALIAGSFAPMEHLRSAVLPAMFFLLVPALATTSTRDRTMGTTPFILATPVMPRRLLFTKLLSGLFVALGVALVPVLRSFAESPISGMALLNGIFLFTVAATCLGRMTGSPRAFTVLSLLFLYLCLSSRSEAALDFAGWKGLASPETLVSYSCISAGLLACAWAMDRWKTIRGD